jgi:hypothetical protein
MNASGQFPVTALLPPEKMPPVVSELAEWEGKGCYVGGWVTWGKVKIIFSGGNSTVIP